jgi:hypothetical protein
MQGCSIRIDDAMIIFERWRYIMTQQPFERTQLVALTLIREGMAVYDHSGEKIGTVEQVHFGAEGDHGRGAATPSTAGDRNDTLMDALRDAFTVDRIPQTLQARLLQQGFVRIDAAGLFASDRYVTPDQIAEVLDDRVVLRAARDELIKR